MGVDASEMIDRVLQAMKDHYGAHHMLLEIDGRGLARAAIEAMREPTEEMIRAGRELEKWCCKNREDMEPRSCWITLIDAALSMRSIGETPISVEAVDTNEGKS